jgi:hypothetical protein
VGGAELFLIIVVVADHAAEADTRGGDECRAWPFLPPLCNGAARPPRTQQPVYERKSRVVGVAGNAECWALFLDYSS